MWEKISVLKRDRHLAKKKVKYTRHIEKKEVSVLEKTSLIDLVNGESYENNVVKEVHMERRKEYW